MRTVRKALLVYRREMLVMVRDRRLIVGVVLTSLVFLPGLFALMGRMTSVTPAEGPVPVIDRTGDPAITRVLAGDVRFFLVPERLLADPADTDGYVVLSARGDTLEIWGDQTRPRVWTGARELERVLLAHRDSLVRQALVRRGLPVAALTPFTVQITDVSDPAGRGAVLLSTLLPYLVVVLLVANSIRALYVAVGEKEKRTLASLLVCDVPRGAIVLGKALAIVSFALFASTLLVIGMVVATNFGSLAAGTAIGEVAFRLSLSQVVLLAINVGGLALLVSAIIMVLGTVARSQREASIYTSPVLFLSIFLAIFAFRSADYALATYVVPILGNALSMKDTILGTAGPSHIALPLASDLILFGVLLTTTIALYHREQVLFRE